MANEVRQQIHVLVKLQGVELEIRKIKQALSQVDRRTAELDARLHEFTAAVENTQGRIQELMKTSRTLDSELQMNQGRIAKSHEKLRSVKTNKEYQSGLKEIEDLGAIVTKIEDDTLAVMEQIESAQEELKGHTARLETQAGRIRGEKESVLREAHESQETLQRMEAEAADLYDQATPQILALYRRVKAKKADSIAIVSVCDSVCLGCNVNIPPQMYNELQRVDRLKNCPNCERIIYWEDEEGRSE
jgi:predicted  nucleic acid-binding Zn-ribbon protein